MGWDRGWVMAFPLVSLLFWGVEYDRPSLNPFCFSEKIFLLLVYSAALYTLTSFDVEDLTYNLPSTYHKVFLDVIYIDVDSWLQQLGSFSGLVSTASFPRTSPAIAFSMLAEETKKKKKLQAVFWCSCPPTNNTCSSSGKYIWIIPKLRCMSIMFCFLFIFHKDLELLQWQLVHHSHSETQAVSFSHTYADFVCLLCCLCNIQKNVNPEKMLARIARFITPSSHANHRYLSAPQLATCLQHSRHALDENLNFLIQDKCSTAGVSCTFPKTHHTSCNSG